MAADACIRCRVTPEIKALVRALSRRDQITESALVKQLLEVVLRSSVAAGMTELEVRRTPRDMRLYVGDVKPVGSGERDAHRPWARLSGLLPAARLTRGAAPVRW